MTDPYVEIAHALPNEVAVGGALITMVEPHAGVEAAYNRWYEDDHFYSGAMAGPWFFSGRRFVATRALRDRRARVDSPAVSPPDAGCYISCYWVTAGQEGPAERWAFHAMADTLTPAGRNFPERTHVYTSFFRFQWAARRDEGPLRAETALAHPFPGLYVEVVDAAGPEQFSELCAWLRDDAAPGALAGSDAAICLAFAPVPFSQGRISSSATTQAVEEPEGVGRQLCLLWFVDRSPLETGADGFEQVLRGLHRRLGEVPGSALRFSGPFVPTVPGTDRYVDELR